MWKHPAYHIVKFCGENRFTGDANNCFDAVLDYAQNRVMAEHYGLRAPRPGMGSLGTFLPFAGNGSIL